MTLVCKIILLQTLLSQTLLPDCLFLLCILFWNVCLALCWELLTVLQSVFWISHDRYENETNLIGNRVLSAFNFLSIQNTIFRGFLNICHTQKSVSYATPIASPPSRSQVILVKPEANGGADKPVVLCL